MDESFSKTFCVLPFAHLATHTDGSVLLCCIAQNDLKLNLNDLSLSDAWNAPVVREARLKMIRGESVSSCKHCYREEAAGVRSYRINENRGFEQRHSREWIDQRVASLKPDGSLEEGLVSLDLRLGNTCNLACVMCRPQDSSKWTALAKKLADTIRDDELRNEWRERSRIDATRFDWYKDPRFWNDLGSLLPTLHEMIIGGGEPMLLEEHRRLVETCVASGYAGRIQIRYHTNGTKLDPAIFDLWRHFKKVEVYVSMDGVGDRNTYMRHPSAWTAIETNLRALDEYPFGNLQVLLLCSVHLMSAFYLAETTQWVRDQKFKLVTHGYNGYFHPGLVHFPEYLSVQVLPRDVKEKVATELANFELASERPSVKIGGIVNFMNEADRSDLLPRALEYIEKLDQARGTNFRHVLPELADALYQTPRL